MSPDIPSRSSLADVLAAIETATMPPRRRQDMASAVRTVAKALDHPPERIPADPHALGARLKLVSPEALGMSVGRWHNVRSLLRSALMLVAPVMKGNSRVPMSAAWKVLFDLLGPITMVRNRLSRLLRWLSSQQVQPGVVTAEDLERFHQELLAQALASQPEATWADTVRSWNWAVKNVHGWPQLRIERASCKVVYVLPWDRFPTSLKHDVDGWLDRLAARDFADDAGPAKSASASTLVTREYQLRAFASALVLRGRDASSLTSLKNCLTIENFIDGLRFFYERGGSKATTAVHGMASYLKSVARHWVRADQVTLDRMAGVIRKLAPDKTGLTQKNRDRLRPLEAQDKAQGLVRLPLLLRDKIEKGKLTPRRRSLLAQMAVAVELLIFAPIRIGNLVAIDLDRHLIRVGKKIHLVIPAEEVKNKADLEFELPAESAALIDWYLTEMRKAPTGNRALFPGRYGGAKTVGTLRHQIITTVRQFTGLQVHPHLFRHLGAKLYLDQNPGGYEVMRRVLGHRSMETTTSFYTGFETLGAARHFDETIMKIRQMPPNEKKP